MNSQAGLEGSLLQRNRQPGKDKFKGLWEYTDGLYQVKYGERIGLGNSDYRLIEI